MFCRLRSDLFSFDAPLSTSSKFRSYLVPHTTSIVPSPFVLRYCWIHHHVPGLGILPPRRTPPCTCVFQCRQYRIWPGVTCPAHGPSHAFGYRFRQERELHLLPNSSCRRRCPPTTSIVSSSFLFDLNKRLIAFVSRKRIVTDCRENWHKKIVTGCRENWHKKIVMDGREQLQNSTPGPRGVNPSTGHTNIVMDCSEN